MTDVSAELMGLAAAAIGLAAAVVSYRAARGGVGAAAGGVAIPLDAPGEAPAAARVSLPSQGEFVNRDAELDAALARIRAGDAAIAIEGEEGIGKSATAMELIRRLRGQDGRSNGTPDLREHNFLWVACEGGCPPVEEICGALSRLTGDQSLSTAAGAEKLNALRIHMSLRKTVLVLDDLRLAEDPDSRAIRNLVETVPEGSLVVVSLDRPDELRASRVRLGGLGLAHVTRLVGRQARALGLEPAEAFGEDLAKRFLEVLNGNPAEIDSALSSYHLGHRSLEDHLAAVERGETLEERVAAQWEELPPRERDVLTACAFLAGHGTSEQLAAACELGPEQLAGALARLVDLGHAVPIHSSDGPSTYTCATRIGRIALAKLPPEMELAITGRLVARLEDHFAAHPEDAPAAIPYVGSLRPVMKRLFGQGNDADLQALFKVSLDILFTLGLFDDRIVLGGLAHDSGVRAGNHSGAALAAEVIASTHAARGETEPAREALAWGRLAAERSGRLWDSVRQTRCDALIEYRAGEAQRALKISDGLAGRAREAGDLESVVNILGMRSAAARYAGDFELSRSAAEECLRVCEEMPWRRAVAYPLRDLAEVAVHEGRFAEAEGKLARAHEIATESEDRRHLARIALTEARMCLLAGRPPEAREAAERAQSAAARLGLAPEATEARAIYDAARRATLLPPLRLYYRWRRPRRLTAAPA